MRFSPSWMASASRLAFILLPFPTRKGSQAFREFLESRIRPKRHATPCNGHGWIALHDGQRWNRAGDYATRAHYRSVANLHVGKNDDARSDEGLFPNPYPAARFLEMSDDYDADPDKGFVVDRDEFRIGGFENYVVTNPDISSDMDTARTMQKHPETLAAWQQKREQLQHPVQQSAHRVLVHGSLRIRQRARLLLFDLTHLAER